MCKDHLHSCTSSHSVPNSVIVFIEPPSQLLLVAIKTMVFMYAGNRGIIIV